MYEIDIILKNESGLHARPASLLVATSSKFNSDIVIEMDGKEYNGKSVLGVLSMGASQGSLLNIKAEGEDEREAIEALKIIIENSFGE